MKRARVPPSLASKICRRTTCCRPCRDRHDCPWQSHRTRTCTRRPWSCHTTYPWGSGTPCWRYSPRRDQVRRRVPEPRSERDCPSGWGPFERGPPQVQQPVPQLPLALQQEPPSKLPPAPRCPCPRTSPEHPYGRGMRRVWWRPSSRSRPYTGPSRLRERRPAASPVPGQTPQSIHRHKVQ